VSPRKILLEGRPGSGKTTVARSLVRILHAHGIRVAGFTTEEIRERGHRIGFQVEGVSGARATLAHIDLLGPPRVGKYGVDIPSFELVALPSIAKAARVVVIDELGKMELASEAFRNAVTALFERDLSIVATVQASPHPLTDDLKERSDVQRVPVSPGNRDRLPEELADLVANEEIDR
jgi:nucleoside-triphosphatase